MNLNQKIAFVLLLTVLAYTSFCGYYTYGYELSDISVYSLFTVVSIAATVQIGVSCCIKGSNRDILHEASKVLFTLALIFFLFNIFGFDISNTHASSITIIALFCIFIFKEIKHNHLIRSIFPLLLLSEIIFFLFQFLLNQDLNGTYNNTGVAAIITALLIPFTILTIDEIVHKPKLKVTVNFILFILCILVALINKSRAALVIISIQGVIFILRKTTLIFRVFITLLTSIVVSLTVSNITVSKIGSTYGRVLKLKIASPHILENTFSGLGLGKLSNELPKWQIDYFKSNKLPDGYALSAGDPHLLFNEPAELLLELGLFPSLLLFSIIGVLFFLKLHESDFEGFCTRVTLISILVASLVFYPLHVNSVLILFIYCLYRLLQKSGIGVTLYQFHDRTTSILNTSLLFLTIPITINFWVLYSDLREAVYSEHPKAVKFGIGNLENPKIEMYIASKLLSDSSRNSAALKMALKSVNNALSFESLNILAEAYYRNHMLDSAASTFERMSYLVPSKYYPKYRLLKICVELKDSSKVIDVCSDIIKMPVKVQSDEVDLIKYEARYLLNKYSIN